MCAGEIKHRYDSYSHAIMALSAVTTAACIMVYYLPLPGFAGMPHRMTQDKLGTPRSTSVSADDSILLLARWRDKAGKRSEQD